MEIGSGKGKGNIGKEKKMLEWKEEDREIKRENQGKDNRRTRKEDKEFK